jgi:hypothetical protein
VAVEKLIGVREADEVRFYYQEEYWTHAAGVSLMEVVKRV